MERYSRSLSKTLSAVYSQHEWEEWKFNKKTPHGFWNDLKNQRRFWDSVGRELGISSMAGWYAVETKNIAPHGCTNCVVAIHIATFLSAPAVPSFIETQYSWSVPAALKAAFPEHEFLEWKFNKLPVNFWASRDNQLRYVEWLALQVGVKQLSDWYSVPSHVALASFIEPHKRSLPLALQTLFPDHAWDDTRFIRTPAAPSDWVELRRRLLGCVDFGSASPSLSQWYALDADELSRSGGSYLGFESLPVVVLIPLQLQQF